MMSIDTMSIYLLVTIFLGAAIVIGIFGVEMTHVARKLAAESGMGEALMGALFIGGSTSLAGIIASVTAASNGHAGLAVSNALGGIAVQTCFLAVADMFYRKANLEHASASAENLMLSAFLIALLSVNLVAFATPDLQIGWIHPASIILIAGYLFGVRLLSSMHTMPMWLPRRTRETRIEKDNQRRGKRRFTTALWLRFLVYTTVVGLAGWTISIAGIAIVAKTGLSEGLVGGVFIAISTSLPELVIAITAVRLNSPTLAVGDIIGGNAFDTLFVAVSDIAYLDGSIYAHVTAVEQFWLAISMLMTGIILMGLLHRERHGIVNIGWESFLVFMLYIGSLLYIVM